MPSMGWTGYLTWYDKDWFAITPYETDESEPEDKEFLKNMHTEFQRGLTTVREDTEAKPWLEVLEEIEGAIMTTAWGLDHADDQTGNSDMEICFLQGIRTGVQERLAATETEAT